MQGERSPAAALLGLAVSLPAGLADVVRGHARGGHAALARAYGGEAPRRRPGRARPARPWPLRGPPAALDPRPLLPLPVHARGRALLVAPHARGRVPAAAVGRFAGAEGRARNCSRVVTRSAAPLQAAARDGGF